VLGPECVEAQRGVRLEGRPIHGGGIEQLPTVPRGIERDLRVDLDRRPRDRYDDLEVHGAAVLIGERQTPSARPEVEIDAAILASHMLV
jgi:hypothetical protein